MGSGSMCWGKDKCKEYYREEDVPHSLVYDDKSIKSWSSLELCLYHAEHGSGACIYPLHVTHAGAVGIWPIFIGCVHYRLFDRIGFGVR